MQAAHKFMTGMRGIMGNYFVFSAISGDDGTIVVIDGEASSTSWAQFHKTSCAKDGITE